MTNVVYDHGVGPHQHEEGALTKTLEHYTSLIPSGVYLSAALASVGLSLGLRMAGKRDDAIFVGHWAPTILLVGVYNKMVKLHGSN